MPSVRIQMRHEMTNYRDRQSTHAILCRCSFPCRTPATSSIRPQTEALRLYAAQFLFLLWSRRAKIIVHLICRVFRGPRNAPRSVRRIGTSGQLLTLDGNAGTLILSCGGEGKTMRQDTELKFSRLRNRISFRPNMTFNTKTVASFVSIFSKMC